MILLYFAYHAVQKHFSQSIDCLYKIMNGIIMISFSVGKFSQTDCCVTQITTWMIFSKSYDSEFYLLESWESKSNN